MHSNQSTLISYTKNRHSPVPFQGAIAPDGLIFELYNIWYIHNIPWLKETISGIDRENMVKLIRFGYITNEERSVYCSFYVAKIYGII